jgi:signal transduction histidine kinase
VKSAQEELARITEITSQTLRFYKQSTNAVACRIPDILDSVLAFYKPRIRAGGLQLLREYQNTEPLMCFAGEIRQVIANLVGNAIDATPAGGRLRVRLRSSRDWKSRQTLGIRITIAGTGRGISRENLVRIFEPFFTTKGDSGTGLGLWITKDLIAKHDGTISFHSSTKETTCGTATSIFLPFEPVKAAILLRD